MLAFQNQVPNMKKTCTKQPYSPMPSLRNLHMLVYFNKKNEAVACYQNSLEVKSGDSKFIVKVVKWFGLKEKKSRER